MQDNKQECPKCKCEMERGYVNSGLSVLAGNKDNPPTIQNPLTPNTVFVCKGCGYVEFYRK